MTNQHVVHLESLQLTIVAVPHEFHVEYTLYEIDGFDESGAPLWHRAGAMSHPDCVNSFAEAEPYLHGSVKWDGCSNWKFNEQERGNYLHFCERDEMLRFSHAMQACYDMTKNLCANWIDK